MNSIFWFKIISMLQFTVIISASLDDYLTHYWPISNGQMNDLIGSAHMIQRSKATLFANDRFGNVNSSINLNGGWTQLPQGIY